jgi:hypothetical protein
VNLDPALGVEIAGRVGAHLLGVGDAVRITEGALRLVLAEVRAVAAAVELRFCGRRDVEDDDAVPEIL